MSVENSSNFNHNETVNQFQLKKRNQCCHNFRKYFREHNEFTGIHGLRYLTEKRSRFEKFLWAIILLTSLGGFIYMTFEIIDKYNTSPVVVSFATEETPIYDIPFPTVTVCPESKYSNFEFSYARVFNKITAGKIENISESKQNMAFYSHINSCYSYTTSNQPFVDLTCIFVNNSLLNIRGILNNTTHSGWDWLEAKPFNLIIFSSMETFAYLDLLCDPIEFIEYDKNKTVDSNFFPTIDKLKIQETDIFTDCFFMGQPYDCKDILKPKIIDQGICYSFNGLDKKEIFKDHVFHYKNYFKVENTATSYNSETGYEVDSGLNVYPRRAFSSGAMHALQINFISNILNQDDKCSPFLEGWRVLVHSPYDVPQLSRHYFWVPLDKVVVAVVEPDLIITSEDVRSFTPKKRKCFITNEKPLSHFKVYTQSNCIFECLTNYTLDKCGCVLFHMPRHNSTPICGAGSQLCVRSAKENSTTENILAQLSKLNDFLCDCKPSCTELKFNAKTLYNNYYFRKYFLNNFPRFVVEDIHYSALLVYLENEQFIAKERNLLYGVSDFISNLGGLLGLFTGFSLITLMEIAYFLTIRLCCNIRIFNNWSGPD